MGGVNNVSHPSCMSNEIVDANAQGFVFPAGMTHRSYRTALNILAQQMAAAADAKNEAVFYEDIADWFLITSCQAEVRTEKTEGDANKRIRIRDIYVGCDPVNASFHDVCHVDTFWTGSDFSWVIPGEGEKEFDDAGCADDGPEQVTQYEGLRDLGIDQWSASLAAFFGCDLEHEEAANEVFLESDKIKSVKKIGKDQVEKLKDQANTWRQFTELNFMPPFLKARAKGLLATYEQELGYEYVPQYKEAQIEQLKTKDPDPNSFGKLFRFLAPVKGTANGEHEQAMLGAIRALGHASGQEAHAQLKLAIYYYNRAQEYVSELSQREAFTEADVENSDEAEKLLMKAKWILVNMEANADKKFPYVHYMGMMTADQLEVYRVFKDYLYVFERKFASLKKKVESTQEKKESTPEDCANKNRHFVSASEPCGPCLDGYKVNPKDREGPCIPKGRPPISTPKKCKGMHRKFVAYNKPCGDCVSGYKVNPRNPKGACIKGGETLKQCLAKCGPKPKFKRKADAVNEKIREELIRKTRIHHECMKKCNEKY
jgi:hypothetical protein